MGIGFISDVYENKRKRERDIGKWSVIYKSNHTFIGKIAEIDEEEIILNPHRSLEYKEGKEKVSLIPKELKVPLSNREGLENVTKKWIIEKIRDDNKKLKESPKENLLK